HPHSRQGQVGLREYRERGIGEVQRIGKDIKPPLIRLADCYYRIGVGDERDAVCAQQRRIGADTLVKQESSGTSRIVRERIGRDEYVWSDDRNDWVFGHSESICQSAIATRNNQGVVLDDIICMSGDGVDVDLPTEDRDRKIGAERK